MAQAIVAIEEGSYSYDPEISIASMRVVFTDGAGTASPVECISIYAPTRERVYETLQLMAEQRDRSARCVPLTAETLEADLFPSLAVATEVPDTYSDVATALGLDSIGVRPVIKEVL